MFVGFEWFSSLRWKGEGDLGTEWSWSPLLCKAVWDEEVPQLPKKHIAVCFQSLPPLI